MPLPPLGLEHTLVESVPAVAEPVQPMGFPVPALLALNAPLADELGLEVALLEAHGAELFTGSALPEDAEPVALAYAGHQFGGFSGPLGDGRALLLGEKIDVHGRRRDLQLKGSGPTPFSRGGDGRATLGPILRELLVSEGVHHLGIPTTRVLGAATTGDQVHRRGWLPGAALCRVGASHLRVGTLELFAWRRDVETREKLVRHALARHAPERLGADNLAVELLDHVAHTQAALVARWMHVGFVHGVMNTDNVALSGETLDYGPCAFMDTYAPDTVFSSIDHHGRYAYGQQPSIAMWNLARLAEAVLPLLAVDPNEAAELGKDALHTFARVYPTHYLDGMRRKLGLLDAHEHDADLVAELLAWMAARSMDWTSTFRALAGTLDAGPLPWSDEPFVGWHGRWMQRLAGHDRSAVQAAMNAANPIYIPRNHLVEEALAAAHEGDMAPFTTLLERVRSPFTPVAGFERYAEPAPDANGCYRTFCGT